MGLIRHRQSAEAQEAEPVLQTCPNWGVGSRRFSEYAALDVLTRSFVGDGRIRCEHCGHGMLPPPREDDPDQPEDPRYRIVRCPQCDAETRIKRRPKGEKLDPMTAGFLGVGRLRCRSCKHKWTPEDEPD